MAKAVTTAAAWSQRLRPGGGAASVAAALNPQGADVLPYPLAAASAHAQTRPITVVQFAAATAWAIVSLTSAAEQQPVQSQMVRHVQMLHEEFLQS
jgi:hypothetical protein